MGEISVGSESEEPTAEQQSMFDQLMEGATALIGTMLERNVSAILDNDAQAMLTK